MKLKQPVENELSRLSKRARSAAVQGDWLIVKNCAAEILRHNARHPEGHFLAGLAERAAGRTTEAAQAFGRALQLDATRYDAAIELASQLRLLGRHGDALQLLKAHESRLNNSPMYLDLAGMTYSRLGLHEHAAPLYERANKLQPGVDLFEANLAACRVYLGQTDKAIQAYERLLARFPTHQRNHYELSRLRTAKDAKHVDQMKEVLRSTGLTPDKNVFLYYAIGKELEDLKEWDEAFRYYKRAGEAVASVANYDVGTDLELIDQLIRTCSATWLSDEPARVPADRCAATPIFIVGLPRTGTTLAERIVSSHSQVESAGETFFLPMTLLRHGGMESQGQVTAAVIEAAGRRRASSIGGDYLRAVAYRLQGKPLFIDKLPENFLYLGFIAKSFPHAKIVHLRRNPMDTCFAMYKQSFFRYAYSLDDLGRYYVAYEQLRQHWNEVLGDRIVELGYEALVSNQEQETRRLLDCLGLDFEPACLDFDRNVTAVATASAVQVREKMHTGSVDKWKRFAGHLHPLREQLESAGITVD
jgi:tetratricopeptide (TPR) repeat protein